MRSEIIVVGSLNSDIVARVRRLPVPGETVASSGIADYPGGKGANQAVAAARLGAKVKMIGRVGSDAAGDTLVRALEAQGVNVEGVLRSTLPTGTAFITTDESGQNSIVLYEGANRQLSPDDVDRWRHAIQSAAIVLVQLEVPLETVERTAALCHKFHVPLMLDPAPARTLPRTLLEHVSWLTPNESESALLLGKEVVALSLEERARGLLAMGCKRVILKLGADGAYLVDGAAPAAKIAGVAVQPVDTTAAGDVFNGAFAAGIARGRSYVECAEYASVAAAISVTRHGAQPSMPSGEDVTSFLQHPQRSLLSNID